MAVQTNGTFEATGQSSTVRCIKAIVGLSGTFSATVDIEVKLQDGTWYKSSSETEPTVKVVELPIIQDIRLNCSAYTSGTVTYAVNGIERT